MMISNVRTEKACEKKGGELSQALVWYLREEESPRAVTSDIKIVLQLLLAAAASQAALCQIALYIVSEKDLARPLLQRACYIVKHLHIPDVESCARCLSHLSQQLA